VGNVTNADAQNGSVTLNNGQTATCTITNNDQPTSLTIVKNVINDNGGTATVSGSGVPTTAGQLSVGTGSRNGSTTTYSTNTISNLNPFAYTLHQNTSTRFPYTTLFRSVGNVTNADAQNGSVTLTNGQSATCTITNNDQAASLTIVKNVINDNGGTATVSAFGITTTAGSLSFGTGSVNGSTTTYTTNTIGNLSAGAYTLHENTLT